MGSRTFSGAEIFPGAEIFARVSTFWQSWAIGRRQSSGRCYSAMRTKEARKTSGTHSVWDALTHPGTIAEVLQGEPARGRPPPGVSIRGARDAVRVRTFSCGAEGTSAGRRRGRRAADDQFRGEEEF